MQLIKSGRGIPLPQIFYISSKEEIKEIPKGVPYIYGDKDLYPSIVRLLEYETLYTSALASGYPFDFEEILRKSGFEDISRSEANYGSSKNARLSIEGESHEIISEGRFFNETDGYGNRSISKAIKNISAIVDLDIIKNLKFFPTWFKDIEKAIEANIHSFAMFDTNMYSKKLGGMFGSTKMESPDRNLLVIDISGSIPESVSAAVLSLSKNLAENFYADILITGSKSTLYEYDKLESLDVQKVYSENGTDNDQVGFIKLVSEPKSYNNVIVFGDDDTPGYPWCNSHNIGSRRIPKKEGKKINKWKVNKLISFHTESIERIAAYGDWFEPNEVEMVKEWTSDLK